jgi:hypothetical protein
LSGKVITPNDKDISLSSNYIRKTRREVKSAVPKLFNGWLRVKIDEAPK